MYRRFALLVIAFIFIFFSDIKAQIDPDATGYYTDALRYSQTTTGGTARFLGMGGVNTALGADMSSVAGNPAGLGFFQRSEASFSLAFGFGNSNSNYFGSNTADNRDYLYSPNLGIVFGGRKDETETGFYRGGAFGIALTRINNFQNQFGYSGINTSSSMTDFFLDITYGIDPAELDLEQGNIVSLQGLAYWTFLTNPADAQHSDYWTFNKGYSSKQEETVLTKGAMNQWNFSYGANFNDNVFIGASVGLPRVRYIAEKNYKETVIDNDTLNYFTFNESLKVRGGGFNFKLGAIVKPIDWVRFGISLQSPTFFTINEEFAYEIKAVYRNVIAGGFILQEEEEKTDPDIYKYNLTTPFRASIGGAIFAEKRGFISLDLEYVPYSHAKLKDPTSTTSIGNSTFTGDNKTIKNLYKSGLNLNLGGELRLAKIYRLRAGYSILGDPYAALNDVNRKVTSISGGAGIRFEKFYFDIALVKGKYNSIYSPYSLQNGMQPVAAISNKNTSFVITTGAIF
jgi:hypothetical protein